MEENEMTEESKKIVREKTKTHKIDSRVRIDQVYILAFNSGIQYTLRNSHWYTFTRTHNFSIRSHVANLLIESF